MFHSTLVLAAAIGWLIGCFTPAVGRKVKAWFTKESTAVVTAVKKKV